MTEKEQKLVDKYFEYEELERNCKINKSNTLKELSFLAPHQVGEIITWPENKRKNTGTTWHPNYVDLGVKEYRAVLVSVVPDVFKWFNGEINFSYKYEFSLIKKDGGISSNNVHPRTDYQWTGEIHKDYKKPNNA